MKLRFLLLSLLLIAFAASAKDVITKTDGTKVDANVEEITESVVKYRKASNPTGPVYSIPLASVVTIVYENGSVDSFSAPSSVSSGKNANIYGAANELNSSSTSVSDDDLMQYYQGQSPQSSGSISDEGLLRFTKNSESVVSLYKKAKIARIVGWAGGILLVGAGIIVPIAKWGGPRDGHGSEFRGVMAGGIVSGVIWCTGFNLWARSLSNKASGVEWYSNSIIDGELFKFGNASLMAGVNVIGNRILHSHGVGLGLKLNF